MENNIQSKRLAKNDIASITTLRRDFIARLLVAYPSDDTMEVNNFTTSKVF